MEFFLDKTVKLFNGSEVSWDEFSGWGSHRQRMNLTPVSENITYGPDHCHKMREIVTRSYQEGTRRTNWNYGAKNGKAKAVMTPDGEFPTLSSACFPWFHSGTYSEDMTRKVRVGLFPYPSETFGLQGLHSDSSCLSSLAKIRGNL